MRLHRRRKRSLHDLDLAHADYYSFATEVPDDTSPDAVRWLDALEDNRVRDDRQRRWQARTDRSWADLSAASLLDARAMRHDNDQLRITRNVDDSIMANFIRPQEAVDIVTEQLQRQVRDLIERSDHPHPDDWTVSVTHRPNSTTQDVVFTITARRLH